MRGHYRRALVAAAATNPLVWLVALLALVVAMCALVVVMYAVVWALVRDELFSPDRAIAPAVEDDGPVTEPTPGFTAHLDEHGCVELLTHEPEPVPAAPLPAAPEPSTTRKPGPSKSGRRKTGATFATPEHDNLTHEDLVRLAHEAGFRNANRRWTRAKLVAVLVAPCLAVEAR